MFSEKVATVKSILASRLLQNEKAESLIAVILFIKSLLAYEFHALLFTLSKLKENRCAKSIEQNHSAIRISIKPFDVKGLKRLC